jgi:hypothetical protein
LVAYGSLVCSLCDGPDCNADARERKLRIESVNERGIPKECG